MHKPPIGPLVFSRLFPNPKPSDPTSLAAHIVRNLIPEVRSETICFYGPIDCLEAQYPGLDYSNAAHRLRLRQHAWHRKLFQVFDELRLSEHEIQTLCRWEGTRWARERYEKDEGVIIRDTTWDGVEPAVHQRPTVTTIKSLEQPSTKAEVEWITEGESLHDDELGTEIVEGLGSQNEAAEDESEDELQQSIGTELHQRLLQATEARARGEEVILDAAWEQWLKEASERGGAHEVLDVPRTIFDEDDDSESNAPVYPEHSSLHSQLRSTLPSSSLRPLSSPPQYGPSREATGARITTSSTPSSRTST